MKTRLATRYRGGFTNRVAQTGRGSVRRRQRLEGLLSTASPSTRYLNQLSASRDSITNIEKAKEKRLKYMFVVICKN